MEAGQTVAVFGCGGGRALDRPGRADRRGASDHRRRHVRAEGGDGEAGRRDPFRKFERGRPGQGGARADRRARVDHAFEAVGLAKLCRQAIESLAIRGTATIVGVLPPDATIEFPWMAIRPECKVQTSRMGSNRFRTDIPLYLDFYRQGRLDLDAMVTRRGHLGDINEAFRAMKAGELPGRC